MAKRNTSMVPKLLGVAALLTVGYLIAKHTGAAAAAPATPGLPTVPNKTLPPAPNPQPQQTTAQLLQAAFTYIAQATANPLSANPDVMEQYAIQLDAAGQPQTAAQMRALEAQVIAAQGGRVNPQPATLAQG